jgi:hypothetical protein
VVESRAEAGDGSRECMLRWCAVADDQGGEVLLVGAVVGLSPSMRWSVARPVDTHRSGAAARDPTPTSERCRSLSAVPEELDPTIGAPEDQT